MQRRYFLSSALGGLSASALGQASVAPFDWRGFAGQSIEVLLTKNPRGELLKKHQREFESLTGIAVGLDLVPEQHARQKTVIEFNAGKTSFDLVNITYNVQKRLVAQGRWLEDLRPRLQGALPADFSLADFVPIGMQTATQPDGRIDTLPLGLDPWILYVNQPLLTAKGLAMPSSFADIRAAAKQLNDPAAQVSGIVGRGLKNANVPLWATFFLGYGGHYQDRAGRWLTDGPEAVAAATLYRDLLVQSGPAGVVGFNWAESQALFMQGRAAMWIDSAGFAQPLEDASRSRVAGRVGYAVVPNGPKAAAATVWGDGLGISATSPKKDAAFCYLLWATGKRMQTRLLASGAGVPARLSPFADPEVQAALAGRAGWLKAVQESLQRGQPPLPNIAAVNEFRDVLGIALSNILGGADPAAELKRATAELNTSLNKADGKP